MKTETTRRAIMAGLAAAPVAGMPDVAKAIASPADEDKPMTVEDYAAAEFEPWPIDMLATFEPPNNEKWTEISLQHLMFIRLAWAMLRQTKNEMIDGLRDLDDEAGNYLFDGFKAAKDFHKQAVDIIEDVEARLVVAGSWLEVNEWEPQS